MNKPIITEGVGSITYEWEHIENVSIKVVVDRFTDEGIAELGFYTVNGDNKPVLLHLAKSNLLSTSTMNGLAKRLSQIDDVIEWDDILTYVTGKTMQIIRRGDPVITDVGIEQPKNMELEYQLNPILEKNKITTIYAAGETGKSNLADYIGILIQLNACGFQIEANKALVPTQGNVLYLDWEGEKMDHDRRIYAIKKGLGLEDIKESYSYIRFSKQMPFISYVDYIREQVVKLNIKTVIIDSQMAATASTSFGADQAVVASQFFNAVRSLNCTVLILDHVNWQSIRTDSEDQGLYGSIVKFNRSRCIYHLKRANQESPNFADLILRNVKRNEGRKIKDISFRMTWHEDGDRLDKITFAGVTIKESPAIASIASLKDQIINALDLKGSMKLTELVEELVDKPKSSIQYCLKNNEGLFVQLPDKKWGLISRRKVD